MTLSRSTWRMAAALSLGCAGAATAGCGTILDLGDLHARGEDASTDGQSADGTTDVTPGDGGHDAGGDAAAEGSTDATTDVGPDVTGDATTDVTGDVTTDVIGDVTPAETGAGDACASGTTCVPTNPCHTGTVSCTTGTAVCNDTGASVSNGTMCGSGMVCDNGSCTTCANGGSCTPTNQCHTGMLSCATGTSVCNDTGNDTMNGSGCGTNQVCLNGTCGSCTQGASCPPTANPCHNGSLDCTTGTPTCNDQGTANTGANGSTCGTNMVCDNGTCSACTMGATCTPTNPCHVGAINCTSGMGVCTDTTNNAMNGTTCGVNQVCLNGTCGVCVQGQSCPPTLNPCHNGSLDCSTGTPTCNDEGTANTGANGNTCGTNMVCDNGTCSPCTSGAACTPANVCDLGMTSCTTGVSVCGDTGNANSSANGTTCATGKVCSAGACDTPAVLTISPTSYNFGSEAAGSSTAPQTFTVTNTGQATSGTLTTGLSGSTPAQFVVTSNTCTGTLAGGASCAIKIEFSPSIAGPYSATLTASATPGGAPTSMLSGTSGALCGEFAPDANTVALWHFDEGSGLTTADASGNGHTGTLGNSPSANSADPSWVTGRFGKALFYASANSQYVQGAGSNTFPSNQVTVEFWEQAVSPYGSGTGGYSQPFTAGFIDCAVDISTSDMEFGVGNGSNWSYPSKSTTVLTNGSWHYVAYVFDGVNQIFYVDGASIGAAVASPATTLGSPSTYQIGGRPSNTFINGTIDEMRLSNIARTAGQISNYYSSASTCP